MTTLKPLVAPKSSLIAGSASKRAALEKELAELAVAGPAAIDARLNDLFEEWSTGRLTKATAGVVVLTGLILSVTVSPWFALLAAVGGIMLAWYAIGQRSWLAALYHRLGYRTGVEIHEEILALKALRGDFRQLPTVHDIEDTDAVNRMEGEGGIVVEPDDSKVDPRDAVREVVTATRIEGTEATLKS